jgi:hypothetical protein
MRSKFYLHNFCLVVVALLLFLHFLSAANVPASPIDTLEKLSLQLNFDNCHKLIIVSDGTIQLDISGYSPGDAVFLRKSPAHLLAADIDRDGDLDLLLPAGPVGLQIWYNDGSGHYSRKHSPLIGSCFYSGLFFESSECSPFLSIGPQTYFISLSLSIATFIRSRPFTLSTGFFYRGFSRPPPTYNFI